MIKFKHVQLPDAYLPQIERNRLLKSPCFVKRPNTKVESMKQGKKEVKTDNLILNMAKRENNKSGSIKVESLN